MAFEESIKNLVAGGGGAATRGAEGMLGLAAGRQWSAGDYGRGNDFVLVAAEEWPSPFGRRSMLTGDLFLSLQRLPFIFFLLFVFG